VVFDECGSETPHEYSGILVGVCICRHRLQNSKNEKV